MDPVVALTQLGGVATAGELAGLTSRARLRAAVAAGRVVRVAVGRYVLPGADPARAAAARVGGVVSHLSAAQHWQLKLKVPPRLPTITVPRRRSRLADRGLELHWADLRPDQVDGRVTTPVQTVIDCARAYPLDVALSVADSALRAGVDRGCLLAAALASPRTGRTRAVGVVEAADGRADNPFESALRAIARGVRGLCVEPQQWVGDLGRVDLLDARLRLVVEAESFGFHADRHSLARDVRRYTGFARLGYTIVRFTWEEVMFDPDYVRAALADLVAMGPPARAVRRRSG